MPSEERERQFERALQRQMRGGSPDAACPDAETLAAYHERTLSLEELAKWKEHIGGCLRCQETLALVEETNLIALHDWEKKGPSREKGVFEGTAMMPTALRSMREKTFDQSDESAPQMHAAVAPQKERVVARTPWRWVVPIGALAAGLLIFVAIRGNQQEPGTTQPAVEVAQNRDAGTAMPKAEGIPQASKSANSVLPKTEAEGKRSQKEVPGQKVTAPPATGNKPLGQGYGYGAAGIQADKLGKDERGTSNGMEVRPTAPKTPAQEQVRADLDAARDAHAAPPPAPIAAGAINGRSVAALKKQSEVQENKAKSVGAVTETVTVQGAAPPVSVGTTTETVEVTAAPVVSSMQYSSVSTPLKEIAAKNPNVILTSDAKRGWRVGARGTIEATADGGKKWKLQTSGVVNDLSGGSAPAKNVCWVVGKAGTILLTTDGGKHWKQLAPPISEDLGGVHAVDAKHASIWNVANRKSFETADGGATWTPTAHE